MSEFLEPRYLGDGVYAKHVYGGIELWTNRSELTTRHWVVLGPQELDELERYKQDVIAFCKENQCKTN